MRHCIDYRKLNVTSEHRLAMLRNLTIALIEHGSIMTTVPKAKEARRFAERLVTIAKRAAAAPADQPALRLRYYRQLISRLNNRQAAEKLIAEIAPRYRERAGGYTRILRAGYRLGDRAPKALFQFV
ncbi:MAG: 50S ribosomal protein L17 [Planctomycetota bacterium]|nr:50S ribosomal protein L17 [Planctomycetota bacterium]MCX8040814.1 50S ribosomal protein L17 [Planctomycetota bacterium]MDW8372265.1 50S ribosomal protein L17 [Planctomycetota bacterium]